jgi:non-specific serine/threonine protein kinase
MGCVGQVEALGGLAEDLEGRLERCRAAVGEAAATAAWMAGRALTPEQAIAEALAKARSQPPEPAIRPEPEAIDPLAPLSEGEAAVAELILGGHTNREIGAELAISERTVERHVANILNKLGLASRAQVAAWVVERRGRAGGAARR